MRCRPLSWLRNARQFSSTCRRSRIANIADLPARIVPSFQETAHQDLLALQWPSPPRNVLVVGKDGSKQVTESLDELINHVHATYPDTNIILEPHTAAAHHDNLSAPIYSTTGPISPASLHAKTDLVVTLGGDGTILHAGSLFATTSFVPPVLSFSMGTLGFLGEWKFAEHKRAWREVYMSGAGAGSLTSVLSADHKALSGWSSVRGKSMGASRGSRVLLRNRLRVGVFSPSGARIPSGGGGRDSGDDNDGDVYAMNEVLLHRGRTPHLSKIQISVGGRYLTEAVADGMLVSTPTGSTAYSLSAGGSIVHPLVASLLLTPICPRSLSFRPLVLPANTPIALRLAEGNRSGEVELSIDGVRRTLGLERGCEVRVVGEDIRSGEGGWGGGIPSIVRTGGSGQHGSEDPWVGGLNRLLKFNHAFGEAE